MNKNEDQGRYLIAPLKTVFSEPAMSSSAGAINTSPAGAVEPPIPAERSLTGEAVPPASESDASPMRGPAGFGDGASTPQPCNDSMPPGADMPVTSAADATSVPLDVLEHPSGPIEPLDDSQGDAVHLEPVSTAIHDFKDQCNPKEEAAAVTDADDGHVTDSEQQRFFL